MQIAVMGAGAMGSLFGGLLAAAGENVTLITRDEAHVTAITHHGLQIVDATDSGRADTADPADHTRQVSVPATTAPASVGTVDLVIVFTKSNATAEAMADAAPLLGPSTVVLTLQNGLGNADAIAEYVPDQRVLVGVTTHGALRETPGCVRHTGDGDTTLGWWRGRTVADGSVDDATAGHGTDTAKKALAAHDTDTTADHGADGDETVGPGANADDCAVATAARLSAAGIPTDIAADPEQLLWEKVLVNVGINAPTALARVENGVIADADTGRRLLRTAVSEAERVARAHGHDVREDAITYALAVAKRTASNQSSMCVDLEQGRQTEVESLYGAVIDRAEAADIDVPVLRTLADLVRLAERDCSAD